MKNLLRFEFRRITRQKSFYICFGICFVMLALSALLTSTVQKEQADFSFNAAGFISSALSSSSFIMLLGIFTALYVCDDNANNTLKNIYARGYSREYVYLAKYISSALTALFTAFLCFALSMAFTVTLCDDSIPLGTALISNLAAQLVMVLGYHALYFTVAMLIGKVGGSVAFNLVGPSLILTVLSLIASLLKIENLALGDWWLDSTMNALSAGNNTSQQCLKAIVMSIIYAALLVSIGYTLNRKKEI